MIRRTVLLLVLSLTLGAAISAQAQAPLTLADAISRAQAQHPTAQAAEAAAETAAHRLREARAGQLPTADVTEAWQRGNQPVYAFGSLLGQRRFLAEHLALDALNHPPATSNLRLGVTVEQPLFNKGTGAAIQSARLGTELAGIARVAVASDLRAAVTGAYARVMATGAAHRAADRAVDAAVADRARAGHRRDAGRATDADVLQFDVHVARVRRQQIGAQADERIARAQLNELMGEPLDAVFGLAQATSETPVPTVPLVDVPATRPDVRMAAVQESLAATAVSAARAAFLPQVSAQAGWEANGGTWASRSPSWAVGVVGRVNLFRGFADQARLKAAESEATRRAAERRQVEAAARLDVLAARARLDAAVAGEEVGRAAVAQAQEGQRIVRDRYEQGLADSVALLRAAEMAYEADAAQAAASAEVLVARAALERALGR